MHHAHSVGGPENRSGWQPLSDHLKATATLAGRFGTALGAPALAALGGLLHDLGKYQPAFQRRLEGRSERVDHAIGGAAMLWNEVPGRASKPSRALAEVLAHGLAGHHAGLPDTADLLERLKQASDLDRVWREEVPVSLAGLRLPSGLTLAAERAHAGFQLGFLGRMLFSCVVDADYRDTEHFYARAEGRTPPPRDDTDLRDHIAVLIPRLEAFLGGLHAKAAPGWLRDERTRVREAVCARAEDKTGLFTLTVPTGGGKTLASLAFALAHAHHHGLERIVYAIPYTSIIDQTAAVFREALGADFVLEHHSALEGSQRREQGKEQRDKLRLAMEDWAAPVIVSTTVQLFESLFADRPSRCRKLHRLARSVIILDEVQTLPRPLLLPCLAALDELARSYGTTVVLCTATQPAFDRRAFPGGLGPQWARGLDLEGRELAPAPEALAKKFARVRLEHGGLLSDAALIEALAATPQGLVIVNTRRHALQLYEAATASGLEGVVHLTTRQHAADRRACLEGIRERLADRSVPPVRLIATSLVECGVDLDFPRVWRAEAGLDQIAQAAGRCNREGKNPVETSLVKVFRAPEHRVPPEIQRLAEAYARVAETFPDPFSPAAMTAYFQEVFWASGTELDKEEILALFTVDRTGVSLDYRETARRFRMIQSGLVPIIIATDSRAQRILEGLGGRSLGAVARDIQPYIVQVPPQARAALVEAGDVRFEEPETYGDQVAILVTPALYSSTIGLRWESPCADDACLIF